MKPLAPSDEYIALLIGYFDANEALDWARDYHASCAGSQSESPLVELLRINRKGPDTLSQVATLLGNFVTTTMPEFDIRSKSSEEVARQLFIARLQQYLQEECAPWAVCRMISPIERLFDFPGWLGGMYDACDYVESSTRPVDCRHLEEAIKAHLASIDRRHS